MDPSCITDHDRIEHFDRVLVVMVGGETVYQMLCDHFNDKNYCEIAEYYGVPRSTARGWITSAKMKLREAGLLDAIGAGNPNNGNVHNLFTKACQNGT